MSFKPDNPQHESSIEVLLKEIITELRLLNMRFEEATETKLSKEDLES